MTRTAMASKTTRAASSILVGMLLGSIVLGPAAARAQAPANPAEIPPPPSDQAVPPPPPEPIPAPPVEASPVPLQPLPPPPPMEVEPAPAPPAPAAPSKVPSYILWGAGGASLILGAAFGIAAMSAKNDFDDNPTLAKADDVTSRAVIADVGLGLGAILVITGTIFFLVDDGPAETSTHAMGKGKVRVDPLVGAHAGGGVVTLRF